MLTLSKNLVRRLQIRLTFAYFLQIIAAVLRHGYPYQVQ